MSGLSNIIESFIIEMMNNTENGIIEIQRNEMAKQFNCAPSQINYVLSTRFTPYKGYYIESKRGGSGYIRLTKVSIKDHENIEDILLNTIGESVTENKASDILSSLYNEGIISKKEKIIAKTCITSNNLIGTSEQKNKMRANILKNIFLLLKQWGEI